MLLNTVELRCYVGQTEKTLEERIAEHWAQARSGNGSFVHDALRKWDDPTYWEAVVLQRCSSVEQLDMAETWWMDECSAREPGIGYNVRRGAPDKERLHLTEAQREVFREAGKRGGDIAAAKAGRTKPPKEPSKWSLMTKEERSEVLRAAGKRGAAKTWEKAASK